jgi:hypothetical protein
MLFNEKKQKRSKNKDIKGVIHEEKRNERRHEGMRNERRIYAHEKRNEKRNEKKEKIMAKKTIVSFPHNVVAGNPSEYNSGKPSAKASKRKKKPTNGITNV